MKKLLTLMLVVALVFSLFVGCGGNNATEEPANTGTETATETETETATETETETETETTEPEMTEMVMNWNLGATIETLDPGLNAAVNSGHVVNNTFEGLMREVDGKPVYAMADSHEVSEDGLVYTFHIRDGVKWSDGKPVTAFDFEYAWNRNTDPATASDYAWIFDEFNYDSCKAIDESTFEVTLKAPADYFVGLTGFATLMPLRQEAVEAKADGAWASDPTTVICNGPFILTEYVPGDRIVLEKNPMYWQAEEVQIDKIVAKMINEGTAALAEYESGGFDFNTTLPPAEIPRLLVEDPTFRIEARPGTYYINLNAHKLTELQDVRVRQALSLVIDRVAITDMLNSGNIPAINFIPPGIKDANGEEFADKALAYGVDIYNMEANIAKAKELMAEAGFANGEGFPVIEYVTNSSEGHLLVAQQMQDAFKTHLGIDMEVSSMEWGVFQELRKSHEFQVARGGWIGDYVDPLTFIGFYITGSPLNSPEWSNEEFDNLIKGSSAAKGQERYDMLAQAEQVLVEEAWFIPIYNYVDQIHQQDYLKDVERTVLGKFYFGRAYIDK
ncbi:peptide ABC transporter substrate-binding protein [Acidaminobacter sp. JC074]|uniref:peptide ABC transporter substrate-binding protein n=1 Tax=Acidaminobacter sp. JC074 TaxID=2530199 RepID=UPI001F0E3EC9|nr:peptide ABC transporter substrate-binding protein [Acidaminobacter sp. JC074]MCH4889881.1 peptide ABC transporter substrate-binding protein [Acidaminobacter sp. JC074]